LTNIAEWEKGQELFDRVDVPPAPPLSPEEALKTFTLAPGYRMELVASEPMVQSPISFEFDPEGRLWVVEYQGYMRDLEGSDEGAPICRVVVLEDEDEDGRMDKQTVFLDGLVMPRSITFVEGGILLQEPPTLWFCEDFDGDLTCDKRTKVGTMGLAGNPQHTANGLRYGIDNWLHNADHSKRHRWVNGTLIEEDTVHRGQFGVSFDESGRFITSYQNSALRMDLIPAEYIIKNENLVQAIGRVSRSSVIASDIAPGDAQIVYPIRPTPAITLGALELRDDGRLETYTIVAGVWHYDGDQFPQDAWGNVFVPESGGHLIGRLKLSDGIRPVAKRYYSAEQEFLASTDERFRPVNARTGPDGALYIADMYHGIIEHVIFMVPWLEQQVRQRKLHEGNDLGRIYRIVHEGKPIDRSRPSLSEASTATLIHHLSRNNKWWRLTAQRLLVEREDPGAVPPLKELLFQGSSALGRLHALWTLQGLQMLDPDTLASAMRDSDQRVRTAAIRLSEPLLPLQNDGGLVAAIESRAHDENTRVRLQATLALSQTSSPNSLEILSERALEEADDLFHMAALTGLQGRETELVLHLLNEVAIDSQVAKDRWQSLVNFSVRCVLAGGQVASIERLLEWLEREPASWKSNALVAALDAGAPVIPRSQQPIKLSKPPSVLIEQSGRGDPTTRKAAIRLLERFDWPGNQGVLSAGSDAVALSEQELQQISDGKTVYQTFCAACHQLHGEGLPGLAPPLVESEWVNGPPERIAKIVLQGLYGPVSVNGEEWNLSMPGLGSSGLLDDGKIASVISYIRRAWGNTADPVTAERVASVRQETLGRTLPWTASELMATQAGTDRYAHASDEKLILPSPSGGFDLPAKLATVYGDRFGYRPSLNVLAPWMDEQDMAEWVVQCPEASTYNVFVTLAADDQSAGDAFVVETEGSRCRGKVVSSGGYDTFIDVLAGSLELTAGINRILMRTDGPLIRELADVRSIRLERAENDLANPTDDQRAPRPRDLEQN